ncbi:MULTISPECIES: hypothetical protein [Streptomyces]|uniref:hypothetical protein n=1 Tax=Streptomyces TaxID=1883 RepID=UPI000B112CF0|nr:MULTISPECIES: hypothetical protein [Streptomyces]QNE29637.1 hypothetical protein F1D59_36815 [Streptomyces sp. INR7]
MDHAPVWTCAADGEPSPGPEDFLRRVRSAVRTEPGGYVEARTARCGMCGADEDEFEVAKGECFCVGCCIPLGITDGGVHPAASPWRLEPSGVPLPPASPGRGFEASDLPRCPAGHDVFHVAVALAFAADGAVRGITVGLRCLEDGASCLYVEDARVVAAPAV